MAGLIRPRMYPIRNPMDNKQDAGQIYNPKRYPEHGGFTDAAKYAKGETGFREIDTPAKINPAQESRRTSDD